MAAFVIWSNEHRAWWRPTESGYTTVIEEAGRYERVAAEAIVARATCDGLLTYRGTDPYTGREYSMTSEVLLLAPEDTPVDGEATR
jgi:hypothetical protein